MSNSYTKNTVALLALTAIIGVVLPANAQRERPSREERREQRQERRQDMTPEQRQQAWQQRMQNMTPEQRSRFEARRQQFEQMRRQEQIANVSGDDRQRYLMQSAGVSDQAVQDPIMAFVAEQAERRQTVTETAKRLSNLMADATATPEAINTQLEALRTASREFRAWKEGALKELDAKISYSQNPRVQSLLVLVGILGDEGADAGGFNAIFPKGVAGEGDIVDMLPADQRNQGDWGGFGGMGGGGRGGQDGGEQPAQAGQPAQPAEDPVN